MRVEVRVRAKVRVRVGSHPLLVQGLRGHAIALAPPSGADKGHKSFQDAVAHFSDLLILEKPPEVRLRLGFGFGFGLA